jgi:DNA-binding MarR family transcriptional regulator
MLGNPPSRESKMGAASPGTVQAQRFASPHEEALLTLMRSADCFHRAFQHRLKPFGLTATQYNVLRILRTAPSSGLTCSAIGNMMSTPEPDITRLLARLKAQKLLRQQRDSHDRRVVRTHITAQGAEILSRLDETVGQAPRELFRELTLEEVFELTRLLQKARSCDAGNYAASDQAALKTEPSLTGKPTSLRSALPLQFRHRPE